MRKTHDITGAKEIPAALALRKRLLEQAGLAPEQVHERLLGEVAEALTDSRADVEPRPRSPRPDNLGFDHTEALSGPLMDDAARLYSVLNPPTSLGVGLTIQFISANPGEGTSTLARAFALVATTHANGQVLLLDMDWERNSQFGFFSDPTHQRVYGTPGQPVDLGIDPGMVVRTQGGGFASPVSVHPIGGSNLLVSRYSGSGAPALSNNAAFWHDLRRSVAMCVVDSQPTSRSMDGIVLCGGMDAVVLVVEAEATRIPVVEALRDKMLSHGANVVGVVFNKRRFYIPKRIYKWI